MGRFPESRITDKSASFELASQKLGVNFGMKPETRHFLIVYGMTFTAAAIAQLWTTNVVFAVGWGCVAWVYGMFIDVSITAKHARKSRELASLHSMKPQE